VGYLRHIESCNRWTPSDYRALAIGGTAVGLVRRDVAAAILAWSDLVRAAGDTLFLVAEPDDFTGRSRALSSLVDRMVAAKVMPRRRGEQFAVAESFADPPLAAIDRGACVPLGVRAYGVHMNGYVRTAAGIELWVGRRALDKEVAPGQLDNVVAGGQPIGLTAHENLIKEAHEEAAMAPEIARRACPVGALSYAMALPDGLRRDTLFVYDLELDDGFVPNSLDGEFQSFRRLKLADIAERVRTTDDFKFNVNLVIIDFLIRHGVLTPEEPDYVELVRGLHR
jgi:8-oxo-dGTP pyrophosphatase MutT (NUDIX family)